MTTVPGFPNAPQTQYARMPKAGLPGTYWEGELQAQRPAGGLIAKVTEVAYAATVTIAAFNSGDKVGIVVNGVTIPVIAATDAPATAALLNTAINSAGLLSGVLSSTVAGAVLTLAGVLGQEITVTEYSPDATTAAVTGVTASVVQQKLLFGMAVVKDVPSTGTNFNKIRKATASTDIFAGVLAYTPASDIPPEQILASGFNPNFLMPGQTYVVERENCGLYVEYIGEAPTETDDVYRIFSGTNSGLWSKVDGGTSQVTRGDVVFNGTDDVGLNVDGLAPLFVASTVSDDATATALAAAWNAKPAYAAVATATVDTSGAESYIILTFLDRAVHTVTAYSPATADITGITNTTTAVAATAVLVPGYSWGAPSITTDLPARARLRLANP